MPSTERDDGCRVGVRSVCDVGLVALRESRFAHGIAYGQSLLREKFRRNGATCATIVNAANRGCGSMVELQPSKLITRVRFPSPAPRNTRPEAQSFWPFLVQRTVSIISCEIVFGRFGMLLIAWRGSVAFALGQTYGSPAI